MRLEKNKNFKYIYNNTLKLIIKSNGLYYYFHLECICKKNNKSVFIRKIILILRDKNFCLEIPMKI